VFIVCLIRVIIQSIITLVHIRRAHHLFPIRAYLPQLVAALEDTDGNVRECARPSVVELFTGPGVTDAARADLKKEMTKKGVRKNIVDNVLAKLVAGGGGGGSGAQSEGSENGDASTGPAGGKKEYVPPSLALQGRKPTVGLGASTNLGGMSRMASHGNLRELSRPASRTAMASPPPLPPTPTDNAGNDVHPVYVSLAYLIAKCNLNDNIQITSTRDLENEFAGMLKPFDVRFIPPYFAMFAQLAIPG
jgi:CLIP-associating protein 1/2